MTNEFDTINRGGGAEVLADSASIPSTYATNASYSISVNSDMTIEPMSGYNMFQFANRTIPNCRNVTSYPEGDKYRPYTNYTKCFALAFGYMYQLKATVQEIVSMFNFSSCTDFSQAFGQCSNLTGNVFIPNNIVYDMTASYSECRRITGAIPELPESLTRMYQTFQNCYNLTGMIKKLPSKVEDIGYIFSNCYNLYGKLPDIPLTVTFMDGAFQCCQNLTGTIPNIYNENIKSLRSVFYDCYNLSSSNIYIHSNTVSYATYFTEGCKNTMNIFVHDNTATYNAFYRAMAGTYNASWGPGYLYTF